MDPDLFNEGFLILPFSEFQRKRKRAPEEKRKILKTILNDRRKTAAKMEDAGQKLPWYFVRSLFWKNLFYRLPCSLYAKT